MVCVVLLSVCVVPAHPLFGYTGMVVRVDRDMPNKPLVEIKMDHDGKIAYIPYYQVPPTTYHLTPDHGFIPLARPASLLCDAMGRVCVIRTRASG